MDIVQEVLEKQQRELSKYKSVQVEKHLECNIDIGHLMCSDPNELDEQQMRKNREEYITQITRDNIQLLVNQLWELPIERVEETIVAKLPGPKLLLPRERKIPEAKLLTKWEKFAKEKGINKKKKDKKIFDTELGKWVPTYGFKRAQAEKDKDWVLEVPQSADPMEDQFKKKKDLRVEKVAKNEIQRMKNIARAHKVQVPRTGYVGPETASSKDLQTAAVVAKASTASLGKFQDKLPRDKPAHGLGVKELIPGNKRKASHVSNGKEKEVNLDLVTSILSKKPKLNEDKAVQIQKREERIQREADQEDDEQKPRRGKKNNFKSRKIGKMAKKPKGSKGNRNTAKRTLGRKRR